MARSYRNAPRISRPLIGALGVTIVLGGSIYLHRNHRPKAAGAQTLQPAPNVKPAPLQKPPDSLAVSNSKTPNGGPTSGGTSAVPSNSTLVTQTPTNTTVTTPLEGSGKTAGNQNQVAIAAPVLKPHPPVQVSAGSLPEGKARKNANDLVGARTLINDALLSGQLSESDSQAARQLLTEINHTLVFGTKAYGGDDYAATYQVQPGERLARIADKHNVTWEFLCRINGLTDPKKIRSGQYIKLIEGPFHAVVNKSKFRLDLYLGNAGGAGSTYISSYSVGLGKDNSTPAGLWKLQQGSKAHPATYYSPRGEGVIPAGDPKNPLGGYWMGLEGLEGEAYGKNSYGIHGTIEPDSIGKQASMGCIRLGHDDIALLFDLLIDGKSKVMIKD